MSEYQAYLSVIGNQFAEAQLESVDAEDNFTPGHKLDQGILGELVIEEHNLHEQVSLIAAQIALYGRLAAHAGRVLSARERAYRVFQAGVELAARADETKKLTVGQVEAAYRSHPDYVVHQRRLETAHENLNAVNAIFDAFKYKARVLQSDLYRVADGTIQRRSQ